MGTKRDNQKVFYYERQVQAALVLLEFRDMIDRVIAPADPDVADILKELHLSLFETMPLSPSAVGQAQRDYKGMAAQRTEREQMKIAELKQSLSERSDPRFGAWLRGLIKEIETRDDRSTLLIMARIQEAAEAAAAEQSEDRRIDQIAGELLEDIDL